jgi:hypothetical protein
MSERILYCLGGGWQDRTDGCLLLVSSRLCVSVCMCLHARLSNKRRR